MTAQEMRLQDTISLLQECNAGVKMGVDAIAEVLDSVQSRKLKDYLNSSKEEHQRIGSEVHRQLNRLDAGGKSPNMMAEAMSWMKTNMKLAMDASDNTVADLITDGCNMGVKSLNRYLNQYENASPQSKNLTKELIRLEHRMTVEISEFL